MVEAGQAPVGRPIMVKKFGGSSVADVGHIKAVAEHVVAAHRQGHAVVVVVSAMGKTTDSLVALAQEVTDRPDPREMDMLLTAGERISMSLLAIAIRALGVPATSLTGSQSGIITNDFQGGARIVEVRPYRVEDALSEGHVVIIAGFQGVSYRREVTTLGRGGSDTTAVALAAALGAEVCEIYSDVDGIYSADPKRIIGARRLTELSHEEMIEMARAGAKVLAEEAVAYARLKGIALYVRASDGRSGETMVRCHAAAAPSRISAVAIRPDAVLWRYAGGAEVADRVDTWLAAEGVAPLFRVHGAGVDGTLLLARDVADGVGHGFAALLDSGRRLLAEDLLAERRGTLVSIVGTAVGSEASLPRRFAACVRTSCPPNAGAQGGGDCISHGLTLSALVKDGDAEALARALHRDFVEAT